MESLDGVTVELLRIKGALHSAYINGILFWNNCSNSYQYWILSLGQQALGHLLQNSVCWPAGTWSGVPITVLNRLHVIALHLNGVEPCTSMSSMPLKIVHDRMGMIHAFTVDAEEHVSSVGESHHSKNGRCFKSVVCIDWQ